MIYSHFFCIFAERINKTLFHEHTRILARQTTIMV